MSLFRQWFRKPVPIATATALEDFLDRNAAFVAQRCLFEYARALAGYGWQPLMEEDGFRTAMERSRWLAYPIAMGLVAEVVEGSLRLEAKGRMPDLLAAIDICARSALARHRPPPLVEPKTWQAAAARLSLHVSTLQAAPSLAVKDIPKPFAAEMHDLVPIHPRLRGRDPYMVQNNLVVGLLKVHDEFRRRVDREALVAALLEPFDANAPAQP